jgi:hypothetical protein
MTHAIPSGANDPYDFVVLRLDMILRGNGNA